MLIEDLGITLSETTPTGMVELSSLKDIDASVGNRILELMARLTVSIPAGVDENHPRIKHYRSIQAFLNKPSNEKMGFGQFETPRRFLAAFMKKLDRQPTEKKKNYKVSLPLLYVAREPGLMFSDSRKDIPKAAELFVDNSKVAEVDGYVLDLNYQLNIVGWNEEDVVLLALQFLTELRNGEGSKKAIQVKTEFANADAFELEWSFKEGKTVSADSATLPFDEDRLHCLSITFPIEAELAKARYMEETRGTLNRGKGVIIG
ncbi:hypothetical protein NTE19_003343 [Vibrio fluvialis]|nr:hypothetical protein [Vibrio fluvialis]